MGRVPILDYGDFYDIPHQFLVMWRGRLILFDGPFDEALDDYPDHLHSV